MKLLHKLPLYLNLLVDFFSSPRIFGILRVFRLLRSLRPLRVINRAPGLKLVVQTLLSSLRPIGNIVLICCTFFIIFGILGVQLFKGSRYLSHLNVPRLSRLFEGGLNNNSIPMGIAVCRKVFLLRWSC